MEKTDDPSYEKELCTSVACAVGDDRAIRRAAGQPSKREAARLERQARRAQRSAPPAGREAVVLVDGVLMRTRVPRVAEARADGDLPPVTLVDPAEALTADERAAAAAAEVADRFRHRAPRREGGRAGAPAAAPAVEHASGCHGVPPDHPAGAPAAAPSWRPVFAPPPRAEGRRPPLPPQQDAARRAQGKRPRPDAQATRPCGARPPGSAGRLSFVDDDD